MFSQDLDKNYPKRIMMLVPHDPDLDPRVEWVINLCAEFEKTEVFGFVEESLKPLREYDQTVYVERVLYKDYPILQIIPTFNKITLALLRPRLFFSYIFYMVFYRIVSLLDRTSIKEKELYDKTEMIKANILGQSVKYKREKINPDNVTNATADKQPFLRIPATEFSCTETLAPNLADVLRNFLNGIFRQMLIAHTLFQRAKASSIIPKIIICHDIQALEAGVKLKKKFKCHLLYDSHELWIEADLLATPWEKQIVKAREKKLIKHADVIVTVTPQIARHLERIYGVKKVLTVPNAEPLKPSLYEDNASSFPIKFLLQGRAVSGRGYEEFMEIWSQLNDSRASLILRSPESPFFNCIQRRFNSLIDQGIVVIEAPVAETDLVRAATTADVGIIPYGGPNLNHVYACPNKLSQYMQAGLAILHNSDQQFVTEIVNSYSCGVSYNASNPESLLSVVRNLLENPELIREMKRNSNAAARTEFNWDVQSQAYSQAIKGLFEN